MKKELIRTGSFEQMLKEIFDKTFVNSFVGFFEVSQGFLPISNFPLDSFSTMQIEHKHRSSS